MRTDPGPKVNALWSAVAVPRNPSRASGWWARVRDVLAGPAHLSREEVDCQSSSSHTFQEGSGEGSRSQQFAHDAPQGLEQVQTVAHSAGQV